HIISSHGVGVVVSGVMLAHLLRIGEARATQFMKRIEPPVRLELVQAMLSTQPQAVTRILSARIFQELLAECADPTFHDHVAAAFESHVVADSQICLPFMTEAARLRHAAFLAERAGRSDGADPDWIVEIDPLLGGKLQPAFCFGLLCGRYAERFRETSGRLDRPGWNELQKRVQGRSFELTPQGSDIYIEVRDARGLISDESNLKLSRPPAAHRGAPAREPHPGHRLRMRAADCLADEIPSLLVEATALQSPAWRLEVRLALLRRALVLGAPISHFAFGLGRGQLAAEITAFRVESGHLEKIASRSWRRIALDRRFQLLSLLMSADTDTAWTGVILDAILKMPDAVRGILAERFLAVFGQSSSVTKQQLARLSQEGVLHDDVLVVLARTYALRGEAAVAKAVMQKAEALADARRAREVVKRLKEIISDPGAAPLDIVPAVTSSLAGLGGADLSSALKLCREALSPQVYQSVVADVVVRGRAIEAFAEIE
ncbi:MAG: hypothetical protein AB7V46_12645, partial [Thermomicrobiales bacterium]